jgi:hypothetical protein
MIFVKWLPALSGTVLALGLLAAPASAASDLPAGHGFYEEITYLMDLGVVSGYPDGTIQPDKVVTRAEAAIMIGRLKGFDGTQRASGFSDVTKGMKASGYIAAAKKAGYISGYEDGTFKPYAPITRGDMAIILSIVFPAPVLDPGSFTDVSQNMRAYYSIQQVVIANIAAGYSNNTFKPYAYTTRGQFSAFLARGLEPKFKNDTHMSGSYLRDKTKTYSYRHDSGHVSAHSFKKSVTYDEFAWTDGDNDMNVYYELETPNFYIGNFPFNSSTADLLYPIEVGTILYSEENGKYEAKITGKNITVKTAYKTFTNAVEVTVKGPYYEPSTVEGTQPVPSTGYTYYMVEGHGRVKVVANEGDILSELIDVK